GLGVDEELGLRLELGLVLLRVYAVDGAHLDTGRVLGVDARLRDDVGHVRILLQAPRAFPRGRLHPSARSEGFVKRDRGGTGVIAWPRDGGRAGGPRADSPRAPS